MKKSMSSKVIPNNSTLSDAFKSQGIHPLLHHEPTQPKFKTPLHLYREQKLELEQ